KGVSLPAKLLLWIFVPVVCPGVPSSSMRMAPNGVTVQGGMLHGEKVGGDAPFMVKQLFCTRALVVPLRISTPARPALVHVFPVIISPLALPKSCQQPLALFMNVLPETVVAVSFLSPKPPMPVSCTKLLLIVLPSFELAPPPESPIPNVN